MDKKEQYYDTFKDSVDYIQVYDNVMSDENCQYLIDLHEKFKIEGKGKAGEVSRDYREMREKSDPNKSAPTLQDKSLKDSYDIYLNSLWGQLYKEKQYKEIKKIKAVYNVLNTYISDYLIKVGLLGTTFIGTGLKSFVNYQRRNAHIKGITSPTDINDMYALSQVCLRKYDKMEGGYHKMHTDVNHRNVTRCAAGILYLNTIKSGGETKFPVLGRKVKPVRGRFVVFPSYYTHMHYGEVAKTNDRYILICHVVHNKLEVRFKKKGE